ncbi:MAG: PaaI family thioesterase [Clostridia bacterium]|nr:PaaI family thioesterase [Clostridia bacterium]
MKVTGKQKNSRMCVICGMDNPFGLKAPFYNMEDGSVMTKFMYREEHQSYPGRVHGGLIGAMLDELGFRACWVKDDSVWGVTMNLETLYRKPVPYGEELIGRGKVERQTARFAQVKSEIMTMDGTILASATGKFLLMGLNQIAQNAEVHEELHLMVEDDVAEINFGSGDGHEE